MKQRIFSGADTLQAHATAAAQQPGCSTASTSGRHASGLCPSIRAQRSYMVTVQSSTCADHRQAAVLALQDALLSGLEEKRKLRDSLRKELESQTTSFTNMEREAQALLRRATQANRKVTVGRAQA